MNLGNLQRVSEKVPIPADLDQADRRSIVGIIALLSVTEEGLLSILNYFN